MVKKFVDSVWVEVFAVGVLVSLMTLFVGVMIS